MNSRCFEAGGTRRVRLAGLVGRFGALLSVCVTLWGGSLPLAHAADGDLDTTFDTDGKVTTDFIGGNDAAYAMALQKDGKIVVAGYAFIGYRADFALTRYNANGSLDTTFGSGGKVTTDFFGNSDFIYGMAIRSDGKIVVAGLASNGTNNDLALARYNANGTLDTAFGTGGKVVRNSGGSEGAYAMALQSDGKIVAAGFTSGDFALFRYNANGTVDTGFANNGAHIFGMGGIEEYRGVTLQPDGKIIGGGYSLSPTTGVRFVLVRFNTDGTLDNSFGTGGQVVTNVSGRVHALAVQHDGKILAGGPGNAPSYDFVLARYHANGALDNTFGSGGIVVTDMDMGGNSDDVWGLILQDDGKIIAAGEGANGTDSDFAIARYHTNGTLDNSFGSGGKVFTDFAHGTDYSRAIALQSDGKLVAAGLATDGTNPNFALVRYANSVTAAPPTLSVSDAPNALEGNPASGGSATFTVKLSHARNRSVSVGYATANGTALSGNDYSSQSGQLTFAPGETSKTVTVRFIGDTVPEVQETFYLDLRNPGDLAMTDSRGVARIKNDDGPQIFIDNAPAVFEGNSGTTAQTFTVRLSAAASTSITVDWATANGTAGLADYQAARGTLTFAVGEVSKTITVQVKGDTAVEPNETYKVNLTNPAYAVIGDGLGVATISNDDTAPASPAQVEEPSQ